MLFSFPSLQQGIFVRRLNRFVVEIQSENVVRRLHLPNSGRLTELLVPGASVWWEAKQNPKTDGVLWLVQTHETLIMLPSVQANSIWEVIARQIVPEQYCDCLHIKREQTYGKSRFDFCCYKENSRCWIEIKSVTLVESQMALFPDAPTLRGIKHLQELTDLVAMGDEAEVHFIIARNDAVHFQPHAKRHAEFAQALQTAVQNGVRCQAWCCTITPQGVSCIEEVPLAF